ncbi:hypothetical protein AN478_11890 [Thiohalorhabdus denitrificans]|uniref:Uncharacterized protein n=1 Tax=Thiohalorhabdus denitrificans TaxID=381306 RepID=A0A0P9EKC1_9GAMM|nr:hypothetical protein [Thiohalorhabdus denitrificans]KPV39020.1 hypothetical protein AN478_11890 [Thiohalorhabdus denitrificans]SCX79833.1 hypothetical protein SAMN05661077_0485 [Thiohalorhabdus denitrificans]
MEILHVVRRREDLSEGVNSVLDALDDAHSCRTVCLAEREAGPEEFDAELFSALTEADRVFCW